MMNNNNNNNAKNFQHSLQQQEEEDNNNLAPPPNISEEEYFIWLLTCLTSKLTEVGEGNGYQQDNNNNLGVFDSNSYYNNNNNNNGMQEALITQQELLLQSPRLQPQLQTNLSLDDENKLFQVFEMENEIEQLSVSEKDPFSMQTTITSLNEVKESMEDNEEHVEEVNNTTISLKQEEEEELNDNNTCYETNVNWLQMYINYKSDMIKDCNNPQIIDINSHSPLKLSQPYQSTIHLNNNINNITVDYRNHDNINVMNHNYNMPFHKGPQVLEGNMMINNVITTTTSFENNTFNPYHNVNNNMNLYDNNINFTTPKRMKRRSSILNSPKSHSSSLSSSPTSPSVNSRRRSNSSISSFNTNNSYTLDYHSGSANSMINNNHHEFVIHTPNEMKETLHRLELSRGIKKKRGRPKKDSNNNNNSSNGMNGYKLKFESIL